MKLLSETKVSGLKGLSRKDKLGHLTRCLVDELAKGERMDLVLEMALDAFSLMFAVDKEYRRDIKRFNGSYAFSTMDGAVSVSAVFESRRFLFFDWSSMKVVPEAVANPTAAVSFSDSRAMASFLLSQNPDIFAGILDNTLSLDGNLNYVLKLAYLVKHLPERLGIDPASCPALNR